MYGAETPTAGGWLSGRLGRPYRLAGLVVAAALLAVGALVGVAWTAGFARVWQTLIFPHWRWLLVAIAGEAVAYFGYTLAYRELPCRERPRARHPERGRPRRDRLRRLRQGGGFALDRAALERAGLSKRQARERVLGLGTLEYAVLAPATFAAATYLFVAHRPWIDPSVTLSWVIGVPVGAALALLALRHKQLFGSHGWRMHIHEALTAIQLVLGLFNQPRRALFAFPGISLYWLGDIFCLWATLHAFYAHTPPSPNSSSPMQPATLDEPLRPRRGQASSKRCSRSHSAGSRSVGRRRFLRSPPTD